MIGNPKIVTNYFWHTTYYSLCLLSYPLSYGKTITIDHYKLGKEVTFISSYKSGCDYLTV